jgi:hypothetical protein
MKKADPAWLPQVRTLCSRAGIAILGWGPDLVTVEAKSSQSIREITSQFGSLGFKAIASEDDACAGILSLSKNPDAVRSKVAHFDISRRPWGEQIEPLIWAAGGAGLLVSIAKRPGSYPSWLALPLGTGLGLLAVWDAFRVWGWRLEIVPEGLRIRRNFRWSIIPWIDIRAVDSAPAVLRRLHARVRNEEVVTLKLASNSCQRLGTFIDFFARNLRDSLRVEIVQRQNSK